MGTVFWYLLLLPETKGDTLSGGGSHGPSLLPQSPRRTRAALALCWVSHPAADTCEASSGHGVPGEETDTCVCVRACICVHACTRVCVCAA